MRNPNPPRKEEIVEGARFFVYHAFQFYEIEIGPYTDPERMCCWLPDHQHINLDIESLYRKVPDEWDGGVVYYDKPTNEESVMIYDKEVAEKVRMEGQRILRELLKPKMKIFRANFKPVYPTNGTLIIAATDEEEANIIARETIMHTSKFTLEEIDVSKSGIIEYISGEY